ncbi:MAG TPA: hypothetical protein DF715_13485 [Oceanicaulis sp.]|uniref:BrnT family toxin n=1 Tax=Glycocaulis albus TaxID=1382801 RepID=A0ABQ1XFV6_9PROT|nr:BrnT family toxin [Glycocaulis albus]GGG89667.1 hypothetical protein GCM10007420_00880 [Glycocaulis albus]HCY56477.1 hypothetical protein [Oceanicaulis sp.]
MEFEWDEAKNRANQEKHGISFDRAVRVFEGHYVTTSARLTPDGEVRLKTIGMLDNVLMVSIIHTDRQSVTRLISARPAKRNERAFYYGTYGPGKT